MYKTIETMLQFISLGSGSSGNCYLLYTYNDAILIDAGIGVRTMKKHFRDYGLSLSQIHYIILTHDHADHVKSVGSLSKELQLPVYATRNVYKGINGNWCVKNKVTGDLAKVIEPNNTFTLGDFTITPFIVPHDSFENVGYQIVVEGVTFCLITDAGSVTEEMKQFINAANYLVIEANHDVEMLKGGNYPQYLKERILGPRGHLSNYDCGKAIAENATLKLKHAWLCHLSDENNHPELAKKTVEQVLASYGIIAGVDFKIEVLKRKVPTGIYELTLSDDTAPGQTM